MSDLKTIEKLIESTRKAARGAIELGASLYELVDTLQKEAIKEQEAKDNGPETPPTS